MTATVTGPVVVVGELMLDVLFSSGGAGSPPGLFVRVGGSAGNTARVLLGLGLPVTIVGRLGIDVNGAWMGKTINAWGAATPAPAEASRSTGYVIIHRRRNADQVVYVERGANHFVSPGDPGGSSIDSGVAAAGAGATPASEILRDARWLHVSGYSLIEAGPAREALELAALAARQGVPVSLDPGVPRAFRAAGPDRARVLCRLGLGPGPDILLASRAMGEFLGPPSAALTVIKNGPSGAVVSDSPVPLDPGEAVPSADVSGAGDAFNAGFIAAVLNGLAPGRAAAEGNRTASAYVREAVTGSLAPGPDWVRVARQEPPVLVSACLTGTLSTHNGRPAELDPGGRNPGPVDALHLPVCPEQLGGLPTPRPPAEIKGGDGGAVLSGEASVVDRDGRDVGEAFLRGARAVLRLARAVGAARAVFRDGSPSCGVETIYDGTFSGTMIPGRGTTAAALERLGVKVERGGR